jgi:GNAT superfamily N-acetyltransferase
LAVRLDDGTPIGLRPVIPADREALRNGFREMSQTSRYMRFFASGNEMSEAQARYFSEIDQVNHVAVCAIEPLRRQRGYGIARFIRDHDKPNSAEFAIAVIDEMQHRGLGTALLAALFLRAKAAGLRTLYGEYMAENPVIPHWLPKLNAVVRPSGDESYGIIQWPIDKPISPDSNASRQFLQWLGRLGELSRFWED